MSEPTLASTRDRDVVLAADDNDQNLQLIEEYLWQWGYEVVVARDGLEALKLFRQHAPSLILLDVMMPNMDGYEACARIKATSEGRRIPVVMLTALTGSEEKIRALEHGADDFLNKPINKEELRARLRSLIRIHHLGSELDSSETIIVTLTSALENKDPRSGGHLQRVASYSAQLCERLGMSPRDCEIVVKGARLHDLGMIGVPENLLSKSDLTSDEAEKVEAHTVMGATILEPMKTFGELRPIVRWHHERFDGRGYPDGLKGDEIPLEARIVAIANRFDEIRQNDPTITPDVALMALEVEAAGGAFDPELSEVFLHAMRNEPYERTGAPLAIQRKLSRPRILCVDDIQLNRELVQTTLADVGFETVPAESSEDAITILEAEPIDLVLLDLMMPQRDGHETLELLRKNPRHEFLPIIVLTSQRGDEMRKQAIVSGADDFLSYPLNRLELITRIRSLLRIKDYHADLEQTPNVICALALALEAKDLYTRGHSQRVGDLGYTFGCHLGLSREAAERIRIAGLLHDIGKIAVPGELLNKPGPLTRDEFIKVIDHPVVGEEICRPLPSLKSILTMIRHHHERFDGRGYPDGLIGAAIPYEVRLLSIVDAYDALTSHRSYRPAPLIHRDAIETLRSEAGAGKWDPEMVEQFCAMLGAEPPDFDKIARPVPTLAL